MVVDSTISCFFKAKKTRLCRGGCYARGKFILKVGCLRTSRRSRKAA